LRPTQSRQRGLCAWRPCEACVMPRALKDRSALTQFSARDHRAALIRLGIARATF
jgi:hypothetical protein